MNKKTAKTNVIADRQDVTIDVRYDIPWQRVQDLLCSAFEGGANYWYTIKRFHEPDRIDIRYDKDSLYRHIDYPVNPGGYLVIIDIEDADKKEFVLDRAACILGLSTMAKKFPAHFNDFIKENDDAVTGDVYLQCCLFKDIVYS